MAGSVNKDDISKVYSEEHIVRADIPTGQLGIGNKFLSKNGDVHTWLGDGWVQTSFGGAVGVLVSNSMISYSWTGADDTNAPDATDLPDFVIGVSADGASTGLVYHVINGAWVATGATVANLFGA